METINYKFRLTFVLCILLMYSCSDQVGNVSSELIFEKSLDIKGDIVLRDFAEVNRLHAMDTILLAELRGDDYYFQLFNSNTLEPIGKIGKKGRGPKELMGPVRYCNYAYEQGEYKFWFYDINTLDLYKVNATASLRQNDFIIESKIYLGGKVNFEKIFELSSDKLIGSMSNMDAHMGRLRIYNPESESIIKTVEAFPEIEPVSQNLSHVFNRHNYLYVGNMAIRPDKKRIVSALNKLNRLDIFDDNGNVVHSIVDGVEVPKKTIRGYLNVESVNSSDIRTYYADVHASENYIFALYFDNLVREYSIEKPITIRVFDWDGNPLAEIKVPDYLETFTIDKVNWFLYGVKSSTDGSIFKYDLKEVIDEL